MNDTLHLPNRATPLQIEKCAVLRFQPSVTIPSYKSSEQIIAIPNQEEALLTLLLDAVWPSLNSTNFQPFRYATLFHPEYLVKFDTKFRF